MAIRRIYQSAEQNLNTADFEITAPFNRGYIIREFGAYGGGGLETVVLNIGGRSMFYGTVNGGNAPVIAPPYINARRSGIMETVRSRFADVPLFVVGPGQTLNVSNPGTSTDTYFYIWWEEVDGADIITPDNPGGSDNPVRLQTSTFQVRDSVAAGATAFVDMYAVLAPAGFTDFPYETRVPANRQYSVLGMSVEDGPSMGADTVCNGLRMWKNDESILGPDEDVVPISLFPDIAYDDDIRLYLFREPIVYGPNEEMKMDASMTNSGGGSQTGSIIVTILYLQEPA